MSEPFLGEVKMMSFNFAPRGWALCNGQLLPINQNQALFSLLGTTYGGERPGDLRAARPARAGCRSTSAAATPWAERGGEQAHTLTIAELPAHLHSLVANSTPAPQQDGNVPAATKRVAAVHGAEPLRRRRRAWWP